MPPQGVWREYGVNSTLQAVRSLCLWKKSLVGIANCKSKAHGMIGGLYIFIYKFTLDSAWLKNASTLSDLRPCYQLPDIQPLPWRCCWIDSLSALDPSSPAGRRRDRKSLHIIMWCLNGTGVAWGWNQQQSHSTKFQQYWKHCTTAPCLSKIHYFITYCKN